MTTDTLALRIALVALIAEFRRICDEGCKDPNHNKAYRNAVAVMEAFRE